MHGVEPIPDAERTARPLDLFRLTFGGANTIATVVLGSFPIIFGLSFRGRPVRDAARCGPRRGDPGADGAVRSAQRHQQRGLLVGPPRRARPGRRLVPVAADRGRVLLDLGVDVRRRAGRRRQPRDRAAGQRLSRSVSPTASSPLLVLVVCIYGFRFMLLVNKIAVVAATVLFLLGIVAFGGTFDPGYAGHLRRRTQTPPPTRFTGRRSSARR